MLRVLITDANSKHCLPLQRHIREALPEVELIGHDKNFYPLCNHYGYLHGLIRRQPLEEVIARQGFDMIIPVGGESVTTVAKYRPELAVLPSPESLEFCFDKSETMGLADRLGVPRPLTEKIFSIEELSRCRIPCPCVIKPVCETEAKGVYYAYNDRERTDHVSGILAKIKKFSHHGILIQEYVAGVGTGFFALYDRGEPKRIFMHQRIREYPITGGVSTAACAYYNDTLKDLGIRLLSELNWHGVAMVEFKYSVQTNKFVIMEINPKFWGSVELALEAGINFGADLIRLYCGERLEYSEEYNRDLHFYWPMDGDIANLFKTRRLRKIKEYFRKGSKTNLGYSRVGDFLKTIRMLQKIVI
ncbi:MAG: carboxylate--amine ligase [Planctomycetota bacterium]|jgi:predicted ATP-grasp superfamily ATP-dependent carboligase